MSSPARIPGVPGKRPPKRAPALRLGRLLTGTIPEHPASADYLAALGGGWQMLGNQSAGDCVAVTWANVRRLVTSTLTATPSYPSQDEVWALYRTQNPQFDPNGDPAVNGPGSPADGGMDIQAVLEYLAATGGPDGVKAVAFAAVDPKNADEVKAAIAIFGFLWTGVTVSEANQQEFSAGQPWDYLASSPVDGGHSVITGGYGGAGAGALGGDEKFITWGTETSFTDSFWANSVDEAWVCIFPEHLGSREFLQGIDLTALAADYKAITGRDLPVPAPQPKPAPPPEPPKGINAVFAALEQELAKVWHLVGGDAKAALEQALADAKADAEQAKTSLAKFEPLLGEFETEAKAVVAALEPTVKAQLEALLAKLLAGAAPLLGKEPPAAG